MRAILDVLRNLFAKQPCQACIAKDYFIAELKQQMEKKDMWIKDQQKMVDEIFERQFAMLEHFTGVARAKINNEVKEKQEMVSVPRKGGIQQRIANAEAATRNPVLSEQRKREYLERVDKLTNSEIEVLAGSGSE